MAKVYGFEIGDIVMINPSFPNIKNELEEYGALGNLGEIYVIEEIDKTDVKFVGNNWHRLEWLVPPTNVTLIGGE